MAIFNSKLFVYQRVILMMILVNQQGDFREETVGWTKTRQWECCRVMHQLKHDCQCGNRKPAVCNEGSNSNRWFVLCLKNVVKLMIFHGDLLVATSHSGGPLCGVPWKPYPLRRSLLLRQHLQSPPVSSSRISQRQKLPVP